MAAVERATEARRAGQPAPTCGGLQPHPQLPAPAGAVFALALSGAAQAALIDRGGGLIYGTVWNVTWLQNWNQAVGSSYDILVPATGRMTWTTARAWADNLVAHPGTRSAPRKCTPCRWAMEARWRKNPRASYSPAPGGKCSGHMSASRHSVYNATDGRLLAEMHGPGRISPAVLSLAGRWPYPHRAARPQATEASGCCSTFFSCSRAACSSGSV